MIGRLSGTLLEKSPPTVLIDVGGVGYEVDVPMSTFYDLPGLGQTAVLLIHPVVREDAHLLYGFLTVAERDAFRQLVRISGVGPRTALSVLSGLSVTELAQAVSLQESARLRRATISQERAPALRAGCRDPAGGVRRTHRRLRFGPRWKDRAFQGASTP